MNLASMFKDIAVTIIGDAGTTAMVHLSKDEGCVHFLVEDLDKLYNTIKGLVENGTPKDAAPAETETTNG